MLMRIWIGFIATIVSFAVALPAPSRSADSAPYSSALDSKTRSKIDADVAALLSRNHTQGATIAIIRDGSTLYTRGYGLSDVARSLPASIHTQYEIGSITKQFTAAAILKCKEAGKISLDAKLATYLPSLPHAGEVTIRQLLTHSSGYEDYTDVPNFETLASTPATFNQLVSTVASKPLAFLPGTQFVYSNTNYLILGRVVEIASGQTWESFVKQNLFVPAGMTESATLAEESQLVDMARGYVYVKGRAMESKPISESWVSSAGGIVSTTEDLKKWGGALASGQIISSADYELLATSAKLSDGTDSGYGFGLRIDRFEGQLRVWHGGNTSGYEGNDQFFPAQNVRIIVLTNTLDGGSGAIAELIYNDLFPEIASEAVRSAEAAERSAAALMYTRSLRVMDALRQPKYLSYRLESSSDGVHFDLWTDRQHQVWMRGSDGSTQQAWTLQHRTIDYRSAIVHVSDGKRYLTARSFFDPTWYGSVRALRLGMFSSQDPAASRELESVAQEATAKEVKVIGAISSTGPAAYDVIDRGAAACPNGAPGRALHFTSRSADAMRQLSDVVIETASARFCVIKFLARGAGGVFISGLLEQHYGDLNGYWIQTDGVIDGSWQSTILSRKRHGVWRYHLSDVTFPETIGNEVFSETGKP